MESLVLSSRGGTLAWPAGDRAVVEEFAKYLAAFMAAARAARLVLAKTGKADLDPDVIDGMIRAQMVKRGYATPTVDNPTPWIPPVKPVPPPKGNWRPETSR